MAEILDHIGIAIEGNTNSSIAKRKRIVASKYWCFTLNNYSKKEYISIILICKENNFDYVIGKEIGEKGTPHLQGYIGSEKRIRANEKFKNKRIHWEHCKGSESDNYEYCTKGGDFVTNMVMNEDFEDEMLDYDELYKWQKEVVDMIKLKPDKRKIYWYWEETGNTGKSELCRYLDFHHGACLISGKKNDILYNAINRNSKIYIVDLSRSAMAYAPYDALEQLKNGHFQSSKYESKSVLRKRPHILVFANSPPEKDKLSEDRWVIKELTEEDK